MNGYFEKHVFFCLNERDSGDARGDCTHRGSILGHEYVKQRVKELNLLEIGKIRINKTGCLDRCERGPVCVIYPDNVWYQYVDNFDLEEIVTEHLLNGRIVDRLLI
jgi:(2Fe-2S) ferredoxin